MHIHRCSRGKAMHTQYRTYSVIVVGLLLVLLLSVFSLHAQSEAIEITGSVTAISGGTMLVGGQVIDISSASIPASVVVGSYVHVTGLEQDGIVIADSVQVVTQIPEATAEATEIPIVDGDIIVIVGPVSAINNNVIVIYDFDIV